MGERRGTKALELWCRRMTEGYPGVRIDNMTTSWRDGLAFCAMIHHFRPDLIDFEKLNKTNVYYNNALAFTTAEKYLGIPALLDAHDMAAYEVPDRLSILTYLSQFYQVFAAQDSHNRLKRSSTTTTDKTQITTKSPTGPPAKMAHVVGVPRREPCQKCNLPVFFAERLMVGEKVYHRTCLKCARCGSQLALGNFYETEVDDQYCCETCPDEEVMNRENDLLGKLKRNINEDFESEVELRSKTDNELLSPPMIQKGTIRNSIKERLAFFEKALQANCDKTYIKDDCKPRPKSTSINDEVKNKGVKRSESLSPYKINSAFNTLSNETEIEINKNEDTEKDRGNNNEQMIKQENVISLNRLSHNDDNSNNKIESIQPTTTEITDDLSSPPELPKTLPPSNHIIESLQNIENKPFKRFTTSKQLVLSSADTGESSTDINLDKSNAKSLPSSPKYPNELQFNLITTTTKPTNLYVNSVNEKTETTEPVTEQEPELREISKLKPETEMKLEPMSEGKLNDRPATGSIIYNQNSLIENDQHVDLNQSNHINNNDCTIKDKIMANINVGMESMQEMYKSKTDDNMEKSKIEESISDNNISTNSREEDDVEIIERLSVVRKRLQQFKTIEASKTEMPSEVPVEKSVKEVNKEEMESVKTNEIELQMENHDEKEDGIISTSLTCDKNEINQDIKFANSIDERKETIPASLKPEENEANPEISKSNLESIKTVNKKSIEEYPKDLDPFKSDEENDIQNGIVEQEPITKEVNTENLGETLSSPKNAYTKSLESSNPFDSSDDEIELEKYTKQMTGVTKIPPPRPPPPRISRNPFGENNDNNDDINFNRRSSLNTSQSRKTPVPTPRTNKSQSQNPTPETTPRLHTIINTSPNNSNNNTISTITQSASFVLKNTPDLYGSTNSLLSTSTTTTPSRNSNSNNLQRNSDIRRSNTSLNISSGGTIRSRKSRRAPLPPVLSSKELFPSNETINTLSSIASTPNSSTVGTPKVSRKKRPAPPPPKPSRTESLIASQVAVIKEDIIKTETKNSLSYPLQSDLDSKLSDEEKALLEGKKHQQHEEEHKQQIFNAEKRNSQELTLDVTNISRSSSKRIIPLDKELMEEHGSLLHIIDNEQQHQNSQCDDLKEQQQKQFALQETNVVYRRLLVPPELHTPTHEENPFGEQLNRTSSMGQRQLEKLKDNKEAKNRNRQSQLSAASSGAEDNDPLFNKSLHGKWKRRKGQAPGLPIPPRRVLQMLPLQEIKHELEIIEMQQQGLEKQGVILEKMIRDRCEGENGELLKNDSTRSSPSSLQNNNSDKTPTGQVDIRDGDTNSKEVENLILQLFELVNEKNELFRRQAELMYLRRQHRLEQEQADLEYEIRVLMAQPERNKTDSDKAREEALIERLVELVQLRNEVVDCLEMDRIRENEEDQSIKQRLESHIAKRDEKDEMDTITKKNFTNIKLSKKEKKKQKEAKKSSKSKKMDADKDADETELGDKQKTKKKRKIFLF